MSYDQHTPGEDIIDLRDVADERDRILDLPETERTEDDIEYLAAVADLATQTDIGDDNDPVLIHDRYFKDYAMELADDIGAIDANAGWPIRCIDWDQAARELQMDYSSVTFGGHDYWTLN